MGGSSSNIPSPAPPAPPAPQTRVPIQIIPATIANNEPSLFNNKTPNINSAGEAIYMNSSSGPIVLVDNTQLKKCMGSAKNDLYTQSNCITTYIKGLSAQSQLRNLTQGNQTDSFENIKKDENFQCGDDSFNNTLRNIIIIIFVALLILLLCKK